MIRPGFTPTQNRMMDLLSDGLPHTRKELHGCLRDELAELATIRVHISWMRPKLPEGEEIICCLHKMALCYRHVRTLVPVNGKS